MLGGVFVHYIAISGNTAKSALKLTKFIKAHREHRHVIADRTPHLVRQIYYYLQETVLTLLKPVAQYTDLWNM